MKPRRRGSHASVDRADKSMDSYLVDLGEMDYPEAHRFQLECVSTASLKRVDLTSLS